MTVMESGSVFLSIVLPVYNEEEKLGNDIYYIDDYFRKQNYAYEILAVDDGSTDHSFEVLKSLGRKYPNLKYFHYKPNRGKGYAVKKGILQSRGRYILLVDAGNCVAYDEVEKGFQLLSNGFDGAFGSRALSESKIILKQRKFRRMGTRIFGVIVKNFLGIDWIKDTQCGFKIFTRRSALKVFRSNRIKGFMFDLETILNARKFGFKIGEFPISWENDPDSRFKIFSGSLRNLKEILKIKFGI